MSMRGASAGLPGVPAFGIGLAIAAVLATGAGYALYPGSLALFVAYSLVYFAIVGVALLNPRDYAHLFLSLMWIVGLWLKPVLHWVDNWPFVEPVGNFVDTAQNWDLVLTIGLLGGSGFLTGRLATLRWSKAWKSRRDQISLRAPEWAVAWRTWLWASAGLAILAIVALNWRYSLLTRGSVAQTPLPWPLGGLYAWVTEIGLALVIGVLAAWDRMSGLGPARSFVFICIEGAAVSFSTSSRALFIFHVMPFFLTLGHWGTVARTRTAVWVILLICAAGAVSIPLATTYLRVYGKSALPMTREEFDAATVEKRVPQLNQLLSQASGSMRILVIERWVGLEGLMSTVTYPERSLDLLARAAFQRRSYGTVDVYTRDISKSGFTERDAQRYHFASPSGPIAFLYFSGSTWLVFIGMALVAVMITAVELLWEWLVRDPLPMAISSWYLAFLVLQLSGNLQQAVTGPVMITLMFAAVRIVSEIGRPAAVAEARTTCP